MATFDSKTIVMMAENGHSVEIDGKKIQMTIVQEAVETKLDYSHLVGKWLRYIGNNSANDDFIKDKWYKCIGDINKRCAFLDGHETPNGFFGCNFGNTLSFDLSNPLDHNPDDVRVFDVPSEIRIYGDIHKLRLNFSEYQSLSYSHFYHCYTVNEEEVDFIKKPIPCIATECKFEDLQEGDLFFATNNEEPDLTKLIGYRFLNKDGNFVRVCGRDINIGYFAYTHYFKITPKP